MLSIFHFAVSHSMLHGFICQWIYFTYSHAFIFKLFYHPILYYEQIFFYRWQYLMYRIKYLIGIIYSIWCSCVWSLNTFIYFYPNLSQRYPLIWIYLNQNDFTHIPLLVIFKLCVKFKFNSNIFQTNNRIIKINCNTMLLNMHEEIPVTTLILFYNFNGHVPSLSD